MSTPDPAAPGSDSLPPEPEADTLVSGQYEAYPYPERDPKDEARRLLTGTPSHLLEIDYWVFGAARPRSRPLAALIAGGGTGDACIMLAQQLASAGRPGQVTYLDLSSTARAVAEKRAAARGLANIAFRTGSLLDLPKMGLGPFDYIDCCGVLHHLADPAEGLAALLSVLAPGGGIGLMVYAPYGRTGVYPMQAALRALAPAELAAATRVDLARRLYKQLPETNWMRRNHLIVDHVKGGDAGLFDLFLHARDRPYTVGALDALVRAAGLRIVALMEPARYDPALYLSDPRLKARLEGLYTLARAGLAEQIAGNMGIHIAYLVREAEARALPDPADPAAVPVIKSVDGAQLARAIRPDGTMGVSFDGITLSLPLPRRAAAIIQRIDGARTLGAIHADMASSTGNLSWEAFARDWLAVWRALNGFNRIFLAAPG